MSRTQAKVSVIDRRLGREPHGIGLRAMRSSPSQFVPIGEQSAREKQATGQKTAFGAGSR